MSLKYTPRRRRTLVLGSIWGLICITSSALTSLVTDASALQNFEVELKMRLLKQKQQENPDIELEGNNKKPGGNKDIVLVNMEDAGQHGFGDLLTYTNFIQKLIKANARGILLHIPNELTEAPGPNSAQEKLAIQKFQKLLSEHQKKIVLVANPYVDVNNQAFIRTLNLGYQPQNFKKNPYENQGFLDFLPNAWLRKPGKFNLNLNPGIPYFSKKSFQSSKRFNQSEPLELKLKSSICVLAEKLYGDDACEDTTEKTPQMFSNWGDSLISQRISLAEICGSLPSQPAIISSKKAVEIKPQCQQTLTSNTRNKISGKVVIVSASDDTNTISISNHSFSLAVKQANLFASMKAGNSRKYFYRFVDQYWPYWSLGIIVLGTILTVVVLSLRDIQNPQEASRWLALITFGCLLYGVIVVIALTQYNLILPIGFPICTWLLTGGSTLASLGVWHLLDRTTQQQQRIVRQAAILSQTRKLLARTATDIHDQPLQDLKLVMDQLEMITFDGKVDANLLQLRHPTRGSISLVEKLSHIGQTIRDHLNDMQTVAQKQQAISPELAAGLGKGMARWLDLRLASGELRIIVRSHFDKLREPDLVATSWLGIRGNQDFFSEASEQEIAWVDDREDIFRFFKEAIANVIKHAQPPKGDATWVEVTLRKEGQRCTLMVENNGSPVDPNHPRGMGTKNMATIAASLPEGDWEAKFLPQGGVCVILHWHMPTSPDSKT